MGFITHESFLAIKYFQTTVCSRLYVFLCKSVYICERNWDSTFICCQLDIEAKTTEEGTLKDNTMMEDTSKDSIMRKKHQRTALWRKEHHGVTVVYWFMFMWVDIVFIYCLLCFSFILYAYIHAYVLINTLMCYF